MCSDDGGDGPPLRRPGTADGGEETVVAAERLLCSLLEHDVSYVFANLGTDHTPLLEAAASLVAEDRDDDFPEFVICPHEFAAMSAAHGYAVTTGEPQAVLVHVDVGTQNLGAAMHNAHRSRVPTLVIAGLAPITDEEYVGSRDNIVRYVQDVFDQPGIVREYCRWTGEYLPPADPENTVVRALERASELPQGPTYVSATREALETPIRPTDDGRRGIRSIGRPPADAGSVATLADLIEAAERPLVVTTGYYTQRERAAVEGLVAFAEAAGAGIVEHSPTRLCFPRDHELHVGFDPASAFDSADLVLAVDADVPWIPWRGSPADDATVVQIDPVPTKPAYPSWNFGFDLTVAADPIETLAAVTEQLDPNDGSSGRAAWKRLHRSRRETVRRTVEAHREGGRLTPAVVTAAIDDAVDDSAVIVNDSTTSSGTVLNNIELSRPGSYRGCAGSGLGWGAAAAVGVKLARPEAEVIATVGDGAYVFANPSACSWLAEANDAPTLTVIINNSGWNAVSVATLGQHPDGHAAEEGVLGSRFEPRLELSHPAKVAGAHTERVETVEELGPALDAARQAVDDGTPAVVDAHVEPVS